MQYIAGPQQYWVLAKAHHESVLQEAQRARERRTHRLLAAQSRNRQRQGSTHSSLWQRALRWIQTLTTRGVSSYARRIS